MKLELRSVRLKNCGPLDDVKLDFFDASGQTLPVCVIGGANGTGKTTVLEVVMALAKNISSGNWSAPVHSNPAMYYQADWRLEGVEFSLAYGLRPSDAELKPQFLLASSPKGNGVIPEVTDACQELRELIRQQQGEVALATNRFFPAATPIPAVIYFPYDRVLQAITGEQLYKEEGSYRFVQEIEAAHAFEGSFNSYLVWLDYANPERFAQVQDTLNRLKLGGKTFRVDRKQLDVVVTTAKGEEHLLYKLSGGEQNILIILMELRRRLLPGSVVLIDEIENSLHPAFQHKLGQGLLALQREIPFQLIVTTHSRTFLEIFGPEHTLLLTPF